MIYTTHLFFLNRHINNKVKQGSLKDSSTPFRSGHECVILDLQQSMTLIVIICAKLFEIFHKIKPLRRTFNLDLVGSNLDVGVIMVIIFTKSF
jgi:hypothetical protein